MTHPASIEALVDQSPISLSQYAIVALCGAFAMIDGFDAHAMAYAAPDIAREFNIPGAHFGPVFSASLFGSLIGVVSQGWLGDRFGRKTVLLGAFLIVGATSLVIIFSSTLQALIVLRFLEGVGLGAALPNLFAITSEYVPKRRRSTFVTAMFCGVPLGAILGGIAAAEFLPVHGWRSIFYLGGLLPLALLPLAALLLPESFSYLISRPGSHGKAQKILRQIKVTTSAIDVPEVPFEPRAAQQSNSVKALFLEGRGPGTVLLWANSFLSLVVSIALGNWLPLILTEAGITMSMAVINGVVLSGGGMLGALFFAALSDRYDIYKVLVPAYFIAALAVALIGAVPASSLLVTAVIFIAGFFCIGAQMCLPGLIAHFYPAPLRASGLGWTMGVGRIGAIFGPLLAGVLLTWKVSPSVLFDLAALLTLVTAGVIGLMAYIYCQQSARDGFRGVAADETHRTLEIQGSTTTVSGRSP
jgi:AAHS family 4-hydroxybenzoate transporter-like MFS transporter